MESRCAQGAASTQNECRHLCIRGPICPVEPKDFLSFCHPNRLGLVCQIQGLFFVNLDFVCDDVFWLCDVFGSQELLGTGAACSTFAVVVPLDIDSHWFPLWCWVHL